MQEQLNEEVIRRLQLIENLLAGKQNDLLNFNQAAGYLSISHSHLYKMTSQRKIPFHKPSGKYLYFFKYELDAWIHQNDEPGSNEDEALINNADNEPGLFDEEIGTKDKIEPP